MHHMLVVDDDYDLAQLREVLTYDNCEVDIATLEAMDSCTQRMRRGYLRDLMMPRVNSICRRHQFREFPFLTISLFS